MIYRKLPGNPDIALLAKSHKERSIHLGALKVLKVDIDGKTVRKCAWCAEGVLRSGNQRYCGPDCSVSAMAWGYPQKEDALGMLLRFQEWKCKLCSYDYKPAIDVILDYEEKRYGARPDINNLPWWYFKRLKGKVPKEHKPEVDHIVPIYKGGTSIGLDNHQAICYSCHKAKTKTDLGGKREKKDGKECIRESDGNPSSEG